MARSAVALSLGATLKGTNQVTSDVQSDGSVTASAQLGITKTLQLVTGTGAGQADRVWQSRLRALTSGANEDIDLYDLGSLDISGAGAGRDAVGQLQTLAEIVGLMVINESTSAGSLLVGGNGGTATWNSLMNASDSAKLILPPDSFICIGARNDPAWAVADSTNHLLRFEASGGNVTYSLFVIGRSA